MQRPPQRTMPPILSARGGSEWIGRVNQKHKQLLDLHLSTEQKERLDRWIEIEFVYSTLNLEGAEVTREQVTQIVLNESETPAEGERAAQALLVALRAAASLARAKGKAAELTREFLLQLHSVAGAGFRTSAGDISRSPKPVAPEHLPALIESACQWCTAESFAELNPCEQASIFLLRLIDLQPFEQANERTALVAASLFTLRSELPPLIIKPELRSAYRNALDEGTRMNTQPMVGLAAAAVEQSLTEIIGRMQHDKAGE